MHSYIENNIYVINSLNKYYDSISINATYFEKSLLVNVIKIKIIIPSNAFWLCIKSLMCIIIIILDSTIILDNFLGLN